MRQMRYFQSSAPSDSTTVVHCSAGVGRSGVAVLMDLLIEQFSQSLVSGNCVQADMLMWTRKGGGFTIVKQKTCVGMHSGHEYY